MTLVPYDQRDGFIWMNGELVPWREAKLHVLSHGLHYASAVFEGERCYAGEIFKLTDHSQRLHDSAKILGYEIPYTVAEIDEACRAAVRANNIHDGYVRPIAWRGSEMMGVAAQLTRINVAIAVWDWGSYFDPEQKLKGIRLRLADYCRPDPRTAPCKSKAAGLYMICTIEKHKAENEGYADALFLDWRGQVAEATGANVFFVKDGVIHTPVPDCFLDGITRRTVIGLAKQRGLEVVERVILPEEMSVFQECFLTGSAAEVTPVSEVGPYKFTPAEVCKALMTDFTAMVQPKTAQQAAE
jgi:branched-chain amino acid aminotransferase